jgi:acetoacetyl-CoA synthetase
MMETFKLATDSSPLWIPSEHKVAATHMTAFQRYCEAKVGRDFDNYTAFHKWSIDDADRFWFLLSQFCNVHWHQSPSTVREGQGSAMRFTRWFPGGTLNYAENLLIKDGDEMAVISVLEGGERVTFSRTQLRRAVFNCADHLKKLGVKPGDRVAGVLVNGTAAIIAMLATAALGAVWSSCSPDFGVTGIDDRLSQIDPKIIFLTSRYQYGGKTHEVWDHLSQAVHKFPSNPHIIRVDHLNDAEDEFKDLIEGAHTGHESYCYASRSFQDPLFILYSSGTTGKPKCIVHGIGTTLLQHKKELLLHSDLKYSDRLFFFTTCGWMMWNWMASTLSTDASLLLYDGSPTFPHMDRMWELCDAEGVTHFGTSPKFLSAVMNRESQGHFGKLGHRTSRLRTILTTGSPLLEPHFEWIYRNFEDVHLASISGGTDIISCFMLGNPNLPVYKNEIQCLGLGMAVEAVDPETGKAVKEQKGELVCTKPFISMPIYFWNDADGKTYEKAYFKRFPGQDVWHHGDFIALTKHDGVIVYGRSDATLNPGGVRIGTAEIYRVVEHFSEIVDAIAVGQRWQDDVRIVLFVKLSLQSDFTSDLAHKIAAHLRQELTPRHVPAAIVPVVDIPYTRSGKKLEIAVTQKIHGDRIGNLSAMANPDSLNEYTPALVERYLMSKMKRKEP